ncbi:EcoAI/FtnUII family type I restriction enzme subunit R [Rhodoferax sp. U11-2br]|uniref:EcoAI/FtnUII family type I restriction enzme subunit R n=1 Tax=Rhodoferax sp. U11-2br TaxID=2838878 RepID=UPI001BE54C02|nr:type I restriction endonuclease subunit R [Rhodoferax sp. U11-2br]MBT3068402.1 DEAD/DEAH box helicase family protein [Rhodoferax sp. U11-2br]
MLSRSTAGENGGSTASDRVSRSNEAETRADHIDPALKAAGWGVVDGSRILREHGITQGRLLGGGKRAKAEIADYVLVYRNTKLATVEAKAWDKPYTEGVGQTKSYAAKLAVRFAYATNGQKIYGIDMATGTEGDLAQYPTPDELWALTFAEADLASAVWRDRFAAIPFEDQGGTWQGRYYQDIAITRVLEAIAAGRDRILLTLATGTGKTFIAFQLAWKLFQSRWNLKDWQAGTEPTRRPRVLFLADRNILADQAYNAFSAFENTSPGSLMRIAPDEIRRTGRVPKNGSIFFTIFQTFMSGPGDSPYFGDYPPDFFDFIVIDECHRGGANDEGNWRAILDYFAPAVQLGLTATPKRTLNANTYAYFGDPVFVYSLKEGINDGFLTPFKVKQIATTLDDYTYTPDDAVVSGEVEQGRRYVEGEFNKIIVIPEREAYRVKLLMGSIDQREKTIVFCASQAHALMVRDLINQNKTSTDPMYCVRVTADDGERGEQALRDFQDNEKTIPTILTTSQKLSTGVDARNVRNIVLLRPINSMIEFKQIIGRGTRLFDGKDYFTIYDFVRAHHHFSDPAWDGEPEEPEPPGGGGGSGTPEPKPPGPGPMPEPPPRPVKLEIKLADGKVRQIQSMTATTFWSADGTPMSAAQFLESLYGALPDFFKDEDELRTLWSSPDTRRKLLEGLAEKGFSREPLIEMQKAIEAENSDLFDVLAYVAFAAAPETREHRADHARAETHQHFNDRQLAFLDFVLAQYVTQGVDELDSDKLTPLLRLKYNNAISDAVMDLGGTTQIRDMFAGFQKYLYEEPRV